MVRLEKVGKHYRTPHGVVRALDNVSLHIKDREFAVVRGPSGSGKTTLLFSIGGMRRPTEGEVIVNKCNIYEMSKGKRAKFRAENIGFVFQMFHLVPYLNVLENVLLSGAVGPNRYGQTDAKELLKRLNLSDRLYHKPSELSAGERQRTAIARALIKHPRIILADEPTGNLDPENAREIMQYLVEFHKSGGTVIVVTHGMMVDQHADHIIHLVKGHRA